MQNIILTLMAVLVTLVLLGSGVAIYENTNSQAGITQAIGNVDTVIAGTRSTYQGQSGYTGISNTVLLAAGVFPSSMVSGTTITDTFGGAVTVAPDASPSFFDLTYNNVPQAACVRLASGIQGQSIQSVSVNGTALSMPVTASAAAAGCTSTTGNTVMWVSK
jgi:hypothetical protein